MVKVNLNKPNKIDAIIFIIALLLTIGAIRSLGAQKNMIPTPQYSYELHDRKVQPKQSEILIREYWTRRTKYAPVQNYYRKNSLVFEVVKTNFFEDGTQQSFIQVRRIINHYKSLISNNK